MNFNFRTLSNKFRCYLNLPIFFQKLRDDKRSISISISPTFEMNFWTVFNVWKNILHNVVKFQPRFHSPASTGSFNEFFKPFHWSICHSRFHQVFYPAQLGKVWVIFFVYSVFHCVPSAFIDISSHELWGPPSLCDILEISFYLWTLSSPNVCQNFYFIY